MFFLFFVEFSSFGKLICRLPDESRQEDESGLEYEGEKFHRLGICLASINCAMCYSLIHQMGFYLYLPFMLHRKKKLKTLYKGILKSQ